jgi:hypothetical protein
MYVIDKREGEQTLTEEQVDIWASYTVRLLFAISFAILSRWHSSPSRCPAVSFGSKLLSSSKIH